MVNVLVRDVPAEVHRELQAMAQLQGASLQQYMLRVLTSHVDRSAVSSMLDEWRSRAELRISSPGAHARPIDAVAVMREEREARTQQIVEEADGRSRH